MSSWAKTRTTASKRTASCSKHCAYGLGGEPRKGFLSVCRSPPTFLRYRRLETPLCAIPVRMDGDCNRRFQPRASKLHFPLRFAGQEGTRSGRSTGSLPPLRTALPVASRDNVAVPASPARNRRPKRCLRSAQISDEPFRRPLGGRPKRLASLAFPAHRRGDAGALLAKAPRPPARFAPSVLDVYPPTNTHTPTTNTQTPSRSFDLEPSYKVSA